MLIELASVSLVYQRGMPGETRALRDVSLAIEPGERVGIAGPVGSGKSSLLEVLAGTTPPTGGRVLLDGREPGRGHPRAGRIGIAFQAPENCLFENSVFADVAFAPRRMGLSKSEIDQRVNKALGAVGLPQEAGARNPFLLSGGEQRRVALAGVLAMQPEALMLDEPTAYLDPVTRRDLLDRLIDVNEETESTIVFVGHDMDELARFAQRVIVIDGGQVVADGPAGELLADEALLAAHGLKPPQTVRLARLMELATGRTMPASLTEEEARAGLLDMVRERQR